MGVVTAFGMAGEGVPSVVPAEGSPMLKTVDSNCGAATCPWEWSCLNRAIGGDGTEARCRRLP
ncbi:unnamed protein product [Prunus armeniaca]